MKLSEKITYERKRLGLTQDALAQKMGVSNQAVSKWESDLSCPDIMLLPLLADVFGITVDELFGREAKAKEVIKEVEVPSEIYKETSEENKVYIKDLPWEDDNTLHLVLYKGHQLIKDEKKNEFKDEIQHLEFEYKGEALNIVSDISVKCLGVHGNICAGTSVSSDLVSGNISAGTSVTCDTVKGSVAAGTNITCNDIYGQVTAGTSINCDTIQGDVEAGGDIICGDIEAHDKGVSAGGNVNASVISGYATAGGDINCGDVGGTASAGGSIECGDGGGSVYKK